MSLPTRKEIRLRAESAEAELTRLKTPEGLARLLFEKNSDSDFKKGVQEELARLLEESEVDAEEQANPPAEEEHPAT